MLDQNGNIEIIWKNFLSGNKEAFAFLYNKYIHSLYRYGTKICQDDSLVKDAIQEVFLDLYMKREKNKTNPENLKYYLILALRRNLIKKLKRNRKMTNEYQINGVLFEPVYSIEQTIIKDEEESKQKKQIIDILNQLPAKQKEALYLRYNEAMEYDAIAKILGISVESVRKQVYRALKSIRDTFVNKSFLFWLMFTGGKARIHK